MLNVISGSLLWSDGLYLSQLEEIEDKDFIQRHRSYEHREKLRWSYWDQDGRNKIRSVCIMAIVDVHSSTYLLLLIELFFVVSFLFFPSTGHPGEAVLLYL